LEKIMANQIEVEYVTPDQAGIMTGLSPWTWRRKAYDGTVSSAKIGKRLLISRKSLMDYIAANTRPALTAGSDVA
jgi:hypothetical protein